MNAKFLETFPLGKKFAGQFPTTVEGYQCPAIHLWCEKCKREQTFNERKRARPGPVAGTALDFGSMSVGRTSFLVYLCAACGWPRSFLVEVGDITETHSPTYSAHAKWIRKLGQSPPWRMEISKEVEKALGDLAGLYRKGFECEGESFGIGALAYYRRIVEDFVLVLLEQKAKRLEGEELAAFQAMRAALDQNWTGSDAIDLAKSELPPEVRPGDANPLTLLYASLSEGLHVQSDEESVERAPEARELLEEFFLQMQRAKDSQAFASLVAKANRRRSGPPQE